MSSTDRPELQYLTAGGHRLEYYWTAPHDGDGTALVFLHEGLGSAGLWRDFPAMLTAATAISFAETEIPPRLAAAAVLAPG